MKITDRLTPSQEKYVHFVECMNSLSSALEILEQIKTAAPGIVRVAAYRYALIEYAKPYKKSFGSDAGKERRYDLARPKLAAEDLVLHQQILNLRDQVLAHSDLTLKEAVVYAGREADTPLVSIGSKRAPSLPDWTAVIGLIGRTLDLMLVRLKRLEQSLPINI